MSARETLAETQLRLALEKYCRELAKQLKGAVPEGMGFALFLFDEGADGNMAYVGSAKREDMIKVIREWLAHVEARS